MQKLIAGTKGIFSALSVISLVTMGVDFGFLDRIGYEIWFTTRFTVLELLLLGFLFALPLAGQGIKKIINTSSMGRFSIFWIFFTTSISFIVTQIIGITAPFSNEVRTIIQLGSLTLGLLFGYYLYRVYTTNLNILISSIHLSVVIVLAGVCYQILFLEKQNETTIGRLFGWTGEPKGLGIFLAPFLFSVIVSRISTYPLHRNLVIGMCGVVVLFTLSATAFAAVMAMFFFYFLARGFASWRTFNLLFTVFMFFGIAFMIPELRQMLIDRVMLHWQGVYVEGVQATIELPMLGIVTVEANEYPVLKFFLENPIFIFTGLGWGQESVITHGYIADAGGIGFLDQYYEGYVSPNSGLVENAANVGILLLLAWVYWAVKIASGVCRRFTSRDQFIFFFFFGHFICACFIMRTACPTATSFFMLIALSTKLARGVSFPVKGHFIR